MTSFVVVTLVGRGMFPGGQTRPRIKRPGPQPQIFETAYLCLHGFT